MLLACLCSMIIYFIAIMLFLVFGVHLSWWLCLGAGAFSGIVGAFVSATIEEYFLPEL